MKCSQSSSWTLGYRFWALLNPNFIRIVSNSLTDLYFRSITQQFAFWMNESSENYKFLLITGNHSHRQFDQFYLLCIRFRCCNWIRSWCLFVSSLRWIITHGCNQMHVFWKAISTWWKSSLDHHLFHLRMDEFCGCRSLFNSRGKEECLPYKIQGYDRKLFMWYIEERCFCCRCSVCGGDHDFECVLLHVLHQGYNSTCS